MRNVWLCSAESTIVIFFWTSTPLSLSHIRLFLSHHFHVLLPWIRQTLFPLPILFILFFSIPSMSSSLSRKIFEYSKRRPWRGRSIPALKCYWFFLFSFSPGGWEAETHLRLSSISTIDFRIRLKGFSTLKVYRRNTPLVIMRLWSTVIGLFVVGDWQLVMLIHSWLSLMAMIPSSSPSWDCNASYSLPSFSLISYLYFFFY